MPVSGAGQSLLILNNALRQEGITVASTGTATVIDASNDITTQVVNWINDKIKAVTDSIYSVLAKAQEWTIQTLNNITEEIRIQKYRFRNALATWLNDPINFWLAIAGLVALSAIVPSIITTIKASTAWATAVATFEAIKKFSGTFLEKIGYIQGLNLHKLFLLLSVDYQNFWGELDEAFMGLAEELEIGVGTLNNLTESIRNIYYSTYTMIGLDTDTIEIQFYDDATKFWAKARSQWERYIRNPQQIFTDAMTELVFPALQDASKYGTERIEQELKIANDLSTTIENVTKVRESLQGFVEALPDEIQATISTRLELFSKAMDSAFNDVLIPLKKKLDDTTSLMGESIDGLKEAVRRNLNARRGPVDSILSALYDDTLDIPGKRERINALFDKILSPSLSNLNDKDLLLLAQNTIDALPTEKTGEEETQAPFAPLFTLDFGAIQRSAEKWFVGEY